MTTETTSSSTSEQNPDWGPLGPKMAALNERQRNFVHAILTRKPGRGAATEAYKLAGYRARWPNKEAHSLLRNPKVIDAINEEAKKVVRGAGLAEAIVALQNMVRDPSHRDHARAVATILDRTDPVVTTQKIDVRHTDLSGEAMIARIKELAAKHGLDAEKLLGGNGLTEAQKMIEGKPVIEGEFNVVPEDEKRR
jgi:phage terminase small subunit